MNYKFHYFTIVIIAIHPSYIDININNSSVFSWPELEKHPTDHSYFTINYTLW